MSNIRDLKSFFRKKNKTARAEMSEEEKVLKDEKVCRNLLSTNAFERAEQVLLYSATPIEIETVGIFQNALNSGKKILYPRCLDKGRMTYHYIDDLSQLRPSAFNILEPISTAPEYKSGNSDICIVPALAYDVEGYRMGYGGGFYDRFLTSFRGTRIGICYADNIEKKLPRGRFDVRVDILITDEGLFRLR